ncbi:LPD29 domain-containing protein [Maribacter sp. 2210JD10-5]|uniref:LPD29 domain-containing protein n=1 Tax=Maribacter sp. 2210JD10-5 TaxID=3386272 RepID=UPI0039BC91A9
MPYITTEEVKEKRNAIKKALPDFKFSVTRQNGTSISVAIMEGKLDLMGDSQRDYESVNHFYIEDNYKDKPEVKKVLKTIYDIAKGGQRELTYDGDYGSVPNFYVDITIGRWDKPYEIKA